MVGRVAPVFIRFDEAKVWMRLPNGKQRYAAVGSRSSKRATRLRVRYAGRSVLVTINDRRPLIAGRMLDLARTPAAALGMLGAGVAHVEAEGVH